MSERLGWSECFVVYLLQRCHGARRVCRRCAALTSCMAVFFTELIGNSLWNKCRTDSSPERMSSGSFEPYCYAGDFNVKLLGLILRRNWQVAGGFDI